MNWVAFIAAVIATCYLVNTFIVGAVFSMIGGWRWDQFGTAAWMVGRIYAVLILAAVLIGAVCYLLYLLFQSIPI